MFEVYIHISGSSYKQWKSISADGQNSEILVLLQYNNKLQHLILSVLHTEILINRYEAIFLRYMLLLY